MLNFSAALKKRAQAKVDSKPLFFNLNELSHKHKVEGLLKRNAQVVDDYLEQLRELYAINNPASALSLNFKNEFDAHVKKIATPLWQLGKWVYFPWLNSLVHVLEEKNFFKIRTARNKLLINNEEQKKFYNAVIGIAGLSVGSSVAMALVLQGGAKHIKLADFDTLALSNTNRVRAGVQNLGLAKAELTARQIYEMNPYSKVEIFSQGLNPANIKKFTSGLNVLVDEMDDLSMKLLLRMEAKKQKVAVVMGADNADMAVIDIERHDKKQKIKFFHGKVKNASFDKLKKLSKFEVGKTIAQLIGLENHTPRMLTSLREMGKTIVSWPQLGGTAMLNGSAIAYCVRKIVTGQAVVKNRAIISLDRHLEPDYYSTKQKSQRAKSIQEFRKIFNL
jgi:tRNA A37 threonylcarbamoyladenosine dehydratase